MCAACIAGWERSNQWLFSLLAGAREKEMNAVAIARVENTEKGSPETSGWAILVILDVIANIDDLNQVDIKNAETRCVLLV